MIGAVPQDHLGHAKEFLGDLGHHEVNIIVFRSRYDHVGAIHLGLPEDGKFGGIALENKTAEIRGQFLEGPGVDVDHHHAVPGPG